MMGRKRRAYDDDDGRTIADMSQVGSPFRPKEDYAEPPSGRTDRQEQEGSARYDRPWEDTGFSKKERRMYILGALRAALLIGMVYIVGFGLVIALLIWLWS